jgi:hypothetical protein
MPHKLISDIFSKSLAAVKGFWAPDVVDNRLNPVHLAVARHGYWIQLHILHIPDRFGFFSSGPPRLQAYEGASFATLVICYGLLIIWGGFSVLLLNIGGFPNTRLMMTVMAVALVTSMVPILGLARFGRRRAPDYDWGDWKLRNE